DVWRAAFPFAPLAALALGTANMGHAGADTGQLMLRLPELRIGGVVVHNPSVVSRAAGTFTSYMTPMMSAPIVGALAGNVLQHLRIDIDYANEETHISPADVVVPRQFVAPFNVAGFGTSARVLA